MVEIIPPSYEQNACHSALSDRLIFQDMVSTEGVADATSGTGSLLVNQISSSAVSVGEGGGWIQGDDVSVQGVYHVYNDAVVNLVGVPNSSAGTTRIDLVVATCHDSFYSGVANDWVIQRIQGTEGNPGAAPAIPANSIGLGQINVNSSGISSVTDIRKQAFFRNSMRGSGLFNIVAFTSSGTFTKSDYPDSTRFIKVTVIGAGGGGGGSVATAAATVSCGSGGGGGGSVSALLDFRTLPSTVAVTIGSGGSGVTGANGTAGGTSAFGTFLSASGGAGGGATAAVGGGAYSPSGGAGGGVTVSGITGSPIRREGGAGGGSLSISGTAPFGIVGSGGDSHGLGATEIIVNGNRTASSVGSDSYGNGGGGSVNGNSAAARAGASGANGVCYVEVYG